MIKKIIILTLKTCFLFVLISRSLHGKEVVEPLEEEIKNQFDSTSTRTSDNFIIEKKVLSFLQFTLPRMPASTRPRGPNPSSRQSSNSQNNPREKIEQEIDRTLEIIDKASNEPNSGSNYQLTEIEQDFLDSTIKNSSNKITLTFPQEDGSTVEFQFNKSDVLKENLTSYPFTIKQNGIETVYRPQNAGEQTKIDTKENTNRPTPKPDKSTLIK